MVAVARYHELKSPNQSFSIKRIRTLPSFMQSGNRSYALSLFLSLSAAAHDLKTQTYSTVQVQPSPFEVFCLNECHFSVIIFESRFLLHQFS